VYVDGFIDISSVLVNHVLRQLNDYIEVLSCSFKNTHSLTLKHGIIYLHIVSLVLNDIHRNGY